MTKKLKKLAGLSFLLILLMAVFSLSSASATPKKKAILPQANNLDKGQFSRNKKRFVDGEILVKFKPGVRSFSKLNIQRALKASRLKRLPLVKIEHIKLPKGLSVQEAIKRYESSGLVEYAQPNYIYRTFAVPDEPLFSNLWGLHNTGQTVSATKGTADADIDAPEAWNIVTGGAAVVAVIDTGVHWNHPDLVDNIWTNSDETDGDLDDDDGNNFSDDVRGWDFYDNDNDPMDHEMHGTHVAGTIGGKGNNGTGITGVNWQTKIMPLRALGPDGGDTADVIEAYHYAASNGAAVVNGSFGCLMCDDLAEFEAIESLPNVLFVFAAGNESNDNDFLPSYPCNHELGNVLCVAATNQNDSLAWFSNYGTSVHLAAPGTNIYSSVASPTSVFTETFDNLDKWTSGGTNDSWALTGSIFGSPTSSLTDSPGANYLDDTESWIQLTDSIDLAVDNWAGCNANYLMRMEIDEDFDFLNVEGSTDNTTWPLLIGEFSANTGNNFVSVESILPTTAVNSSNFWLRFSLSADDMDNYDGVYLDDLSIDCQNSALSEGTYKYLMGTSMATPHVAGAAALLFNAKPTASVSEVRSAILSGVDVKSGLSGEVATSGRLNVYRSLLHLFDKTPPTVTGFSVGLNNPIYTTSTKVSLFNSANDASGMGKMRFSNDNTSWSSTQAYAASRSAWYLTSGNGLKRVYARLMDKPGNLSLTSDAIIYDSRAPYVKAGTAVGVKRLTSSTWRVTGYPDDIPCAGRAGACSNKSKQIVKIYNSKGLMIAQRSSSYVNDGSAAVTNFSLAGGTYNLKIYFQDLAGNMRLVRLATVVR